MPVTDELRQRQIREVLDYDIIQNKRVFDNQVKNVDAFTETNAQPKKADIEFEAEVKNKVSEIVIKLNTLMTNINSKVESLKAPEFKFDYSERPSQEEEEEEETPGTEGPRTVSSDTLSTGRMRRLGTEINRLSLQNIGFTTDLQNTIDNILASIYSSYNGLVDRINSRFRNSQGFSAQGKSNIMALLQPLTDSAKESLASIIVIRDIDESLYNRVYNLLYEIIQSIDNAYPLMRLDVTKIADSHYATVPQVEVNTDEYRKQMGDYYEQVSAKRQEINVQLSELEALRNQINTIASSANFDPNDQDFQDLLNTYLAKNADFAELQNEGDRTLRSAIASAQEKQRKSADVVSSIDDEVKQRISDLQEKIEVLKEQKASLLSGFRKVSPQTLRGIDIKINKLLDNINKLHNSASQVQQAYKTFDETNPFYRRGPDELSVKLPTATETMTASLPKVGKPEKPRRARRIAEERGQEQAMRDLEQRAGLPEGFFERMTPEERDEVSRNLVDLDVPLREIYSTTRPAQRPQEPEQVRRRREAEEERIREEQQAMIDAEERAIQEQAMRDTERRAGLPQGFFERIGEGKKKTKKGGMMRKPQSKVRDVFKDLKTKANAIEPGLGPRIENEVVRIRNEGVNNEPGILARLREIFRGAPGAIADILIEFARAAISGLGRKTESSKLGSENPGKPKKGGARKDLTPDEVNAVMIKRNKAFAKNNIDTQPAEGPVPYLGLKPDNSMGAGKKFDADSAKVLDNLMQKEKVKAGAKKSKKSKQLPALIFDDKKNDWYL